MASSLLAHLIKRGDQVEIIDGRLSIQSASGSLVPEDWLQTHEVELIVSILRAVNIKAFRYQSYSCGLTPSCRYPGVHLQFIDIESQEPVFCSFNVEVDYCRGPKKGKPLPRGKFRVGKSESCAFKKFWIRTGLRNPPRRGLYHEYMGNLKPLIFTGNIKSGQKLDKHKLAPLTLSFHQIRESLLPDSCIDQTDTYDKHTQHIQEAYNSHTDSTYNRHVLRPISSVLQRESSTCKKKCGISYTGSTVTGDCNCTSYGRRKAPQEQTNEEWLEDYDNNELLSAYRKKRF